MNVMYCLKLMLCAVCVCGCPRQGYVTGNRKEEVDERIEKLLKKYDQDDDGEISFDEFVELFDECDLY